MKPLPGSDCVLRLIRLRDEMISGTYEGPIVGIISDSKMNCPFMIRDAADIEVLGKFTADQIPSVRIRGGTAGDILVRPKKPHTLKLRNDGAGKPIFLTNLDE